MDVTSVDVGVCPLGVVVPVDVGADDEPVDDEPVDVALDAVPVEEVLTDDEPVEVEPVEVPVDVS